MGGAHSTQDDLICLKSSEPTTKQRQGAFQRLRNTLTKKLTPVQLLQAIAQVESQRYEPIWPIPPAGASRLDKQTLADRVHGVLFGAALGDAAGLATEFLNREQVTGFYGLDADFVPGKNVYPDEHRMMWCPGDWTDDTDQHVLLLQSLLHTGGRADPIDFATRLLTWRATGFPELGDESAAGLGQATKAVLNDKNFATSPHQVAAAHTSKTPSNGGIMRTAVAGAPFFWDENIITENTDCLCRTTHANPLCVASCIAVTSCIGRLLQGCDQVNENNDDTDPLYHGVIGPAIARAQATLQTMGHPIPDEDLLAHTRAQDLTELALDEVHRIGYTYKCLGAGFWALRSEQGFRATLNAIIQQGGDADTNCSVAGALLGCRLGYSRLPADWIAGMPYSSWLEAYSQKLLFMLHLR